MIDYIKCILRKEERKKKKKEKKERKNFQLERSLMRNLYSFLSCSL